MHFKKSGSFSKQIDFYGNIESDRLEKKLCEIDKVLEEGAMKASYVARKKLAKVYRKVGLR